MGKWHIYLFMLLFIFILSGCHSDLQVQHSEEIDIFSDIQALEINLIMDSDLYEQMMSESHTDDDLLNMNASVPDNPYNWYPADVEINGIRMNNIGVRNRGFIGSLTSSNPRFKLKLDKYVPGQNYFGIKDITVSNSSGDFLRFRTHLIYDLFEAAGYPAPRSSVVHVSLNDTFIGVSINIEPIDEAFLKRYFGNDDGFHYEGEKYADFIFERLHRFSPKNDYSEMNEASLRDLSKALEVSDDKLIEELSKLLDINQFITFWAINIVANNSDSYSDGQNNFHIYFNPTNDNRATLLPWGPDKAFGDYNIPVSNHLQAEIPRRLSRIPELNERMEQELLRIISDVWDEKEIIDKIDRYSELVKSSGDYIDNFDEEVENLKLWVRNRSVQIREVISDGIPVGNGVSIKGEEMVDLKTNQAKDKYGEKNINSNESDKEDYYDKKDNFAKKSAEDYGKSDSLEEIAASVGMTVEELAAEKGMTIEELEQSLMFLKKTTLKSPVGDKKMDISKESLTTNNFMNSEMKYLGATLIALVILLIVTIMRRFIK